MKIPDTLSLAAKLFGGGRRVENSGSIYIAIVSFSWICVLVWVVIRRQGCVLADVRSWS